MKDLQEIVYAYQLAATAVTLNDLEGRSPRLRAEWVVFKEIFCSLASCCLSPMKRNSVFEELRVKRLEVIQEEICCRAPCRCVMLECTSGGWKEKKSCVSSAYRWWFRERDEMSELRGVCRWQKEESQEQSLGTPQNRYGGRRNYFCISHGKDGRTDKIWTSQGQCQLFQTTRKDETIRCYGQ